MEKKLTKAMKNTDIIAMLTGEPVIHGTTLDEAIAHLQHENDLLAKKNSGKSDKPSKVQQENIAYKSQIMHFLLTLDHGVTATEVMNAVGLSSNQKATRLLKDMEKAGTVVNTMVKGKSLFSIGNITTDDE